MLSKVLISVAAFAVGVYAQNSSAAAAGPVPTSIGQLDPCIINCTTTAAVSSGCVSVTNFTCVCTSAAFQSAATQCLTSQCTAADLQTTLQLDKAECANFTAPSGNSTSGNSTSTSGNSTNPSATAPGGSSPTNGTTPPATSSTSAGVAQQLTLSVTHMIGLAGALAGVMTGFGLLL